MSFCDTRFFWGVCCHQLKVLGYGDEHTVLQGVTYTTASSLLFRIVDLPWEVYSTFVVEERHGFNKQTLAFFVKDQLKSTVIYTSLTAVVFGLLLYVIEWGGQNFFYYAYLLMLGVSVFMFGT